MYKQHIIIDFEMNPIPCKNKGDNPRITREIIEIGAVRLDETFQKKDTFTCLIKPANNAIVSSYITKLTGIRTVDVCNAVSFEKGIQMLSEWIGSDIGRIYSWSDSDFIQLRRECDYKNVHFPKNMSRWMDFQKVFPRLIGIISDNKAMALHRAASWVGLEMDDKHSHRALYDAEITSEMVSGVLKGEYKHIRNYIRENPEREKGRTTFSIEDMCGDVFRQLLAQLQPELTPAI